MSFYEKYRVNSIKQKFYKAYNSKGEFLYNIDAKDEGKLTNQYLKGVTCFVVNEKGEILIEKRANTQLTPGKIDLVSGHIDKDEVGRQSMIRELWEEVGISQNQSINICKIDTKPLTFESKGKKRNFFIEFYYLLTKNLDLTMQKSEVEDLQWIPMEEVFEMIRLGKTKFPMQSSIVNYESIFQVVQQAYLDKIVVKNQKEKKVLGE